MFSNCATITVHSVQMIMSVSIYPNWFSTVISFTAPFLHLSLHTYVHPIETVIAFEKACRTVGVFDSLHLNVISLIPITNDMLY